MSASNRYGSIRKSYRSVQADKQRLCTFVRKASQNPRFAEWMNSESIRCDEFLNCARVARESSQPVLLQETRQASLRWVELVGRLIECSRGNVRGCLPLVSNVSNIEEPLKTEVRDFLLSQTKVPHFIDAAHRLLFLAFFCDAGKNAQCKDALIDRVLDEPSWILDPEILSCVALLQGPSCIGLVLEAAARTKSAKSRKEIILALQGMTGKPQVQSDKAYIQDLRKWYDSHKDKLAVDTHALYPAPAPSALFTIES
jgi:hypothetical protein